MVARCISPSGNRSVLIYRDKTSKQQRMEIYEQSKLIHRIESTSTHGSILVGDVTFGSPSFSGDDEDYFLYTAERKPPPSTSYWSRKDTQTTPEKKNDDEDINLRGSQHVLGKGISEPWGERYDSQEVPLTDVYLLHLPSGTCLGRVPILDDIHYHPDSTLDSVCVSQPRFHPTNTNQIAVTVFDAGGLGQMTRRLGMVFCRNRHSQIVTVDISRWRKEQEKKYSLQVDNQTIEDTTTEDETEPTSSSSSSTSATTTVVVTSKFQLARSPRYIQRLDGSVVMVFLGHRTGFQSHDGCMGLYVFDEQEAGSSNIQEIIPVIDSPTTKDSQEDSQPTTVLGMGFPGIFTGDIPSECHIPGTNCILLNIVWGSVSRILAVDVMTRKWNLIQVDPNDDPESSLCSNSLTCIGQDTMIVTRTCSNLPEQLWKVPFSVETNGEMTTGVGTQLVDFGSMARTTYSSVSQASQNEPASFDVEILSVTPDDASPPIQAILFLPRLAEGKVPLVVVPHGGPHGCSTTAFIPGFALLATRYAVLLPNYRGSTGFGQGPLTSLLGHIGRMDVDDVMTCTRVALDRYGDSRIDSARIGICGGSHGGFLTAHCTSQYPDFFKAAVMRNPVTNIASMVTSTDIPDWCHAECLGSTLDNGIHYRGPTQVELNVMYEKSPIGLISEVRTPTLIALGLKDLRVPPSQGQEWYYTLRSRGVPTELLIYPEDNHSLAGAATEADHWIRIMEWFDKYL